MLNKTQHKIDTGHIFNKDFQILKSETNLLEELEIYRLNKKQISLNDRTDVTRSPLSNLFV